MGGPVSWVTCVRTSVYRLSVCVSITNVSLMCPFYPAEADAGGGGGGGGPTVRSEARDGDGWRPARAAALGSGDGGLTVVPAMHAALCTLEKVQVCECVRVCARAALGMD